jgi:hypothetical protein
MLNSGLFETIMVLKIGCPLKVVCAQKKRKIVRVSVVRQQTIGGALENAHLTYYLFKIWTICTIF